jgi:hypothetical protein
MIRCPVPDTMRHIRAATYGVGVAIAVFVYLGLPRLRELYGPEATLVAYAGIALIAGGITYSLTMRLTAWLERDQEPMRTEIVDADAESDGEDEPKTAAVKQELEQLREDE